MRDLAFSPDGRRLVSSSDDSTVRGWDITSATPATVALPPSHGEARLSEDGCFTATSSEPGTISVFPTQAQQNVTTLHNAPPDLRFMSVNAGGRGVAAARRGSEGPS